MVVPSPRTLPTNWRITPSPPLAVTVPDCGGQVAGDEPDQRGLARPVRPDQGGHRALTDPERGVVQQYPPVRQRLAQVRHLDVTHLGPLPVRWSTAVPASR